MATTTQHQRAHVRTGGAEGSRVAPEPDGQPIAARLTTERVWQQLAKASFAVLSHVTPTGEPRSSGVLYKAVRQRLYIATAPNSWKARHIARNGRVAVTVSVRRGGLVSLVLPIPPATVSFHGTAILHPADSPQLRPLLKELASLLPEERRASAAVIEILPEGPFVTYGVGVSLTQMRDPAAAGARVPVTQEGSTR
jgi:hypothetical protein